MLRKYRFADLACWKEFSKTTKEWERSGNRISEHFCQRKATSSYRYGNPDTGTVKLIYLPVLIIFYTSTASTQRSLTILQTLKHLTREHLLMKTLFFTNNKAKFKWYFKKQKNLLGSPLFLRASCLTEVFTSTQSHWIMIEWMWNSHSLKKTMT